MHSRPVRDNSLSRWLSLFLSAGSSALLLSIAHLLPELWFLSLFALVPYLWQLKRSSLSGSMALGVILGVCFTFVVFAENLRLAPFSFTITLGVLVSIFSLFSISVNRVKRYVGFYPIFIAVLWMPLEYFLFRYAGVGFIFDFSASGSGWLIRFGSLFGLLMISFLIILVNSILVMLLEYVSRIDFTVSGLRFPSAIILLPILEHIKSTRRWDCLPDLRAPPSFG